MHRLDLRGHHGAELDTGAIEAHLRKDGVIAYPTETVYGLGCLLRPKALASLSRIKSRTQQRPFLLLVADETQVEMLGWTEEARELAEVFWPGSLTLVLADPGRRFPAEVRNPQGGVAVRRSSHPVADHLVRSLGEPLTSTSANRAGEDPATSGEGAAAVLEGFEIEPHPWVLNVGPLPDREVSTIVDCTGSAPRVVREGATPVTRLRCVLPDLSGESSVRS